MAMKYWEMCGALVEMKEHFQERLKSAKRDVDRNEDATMVDYYAKDLSKYERYIAVIDAAGDALTQSCVKK